MWPFASSSESGWDRQSRVPSEVLVLGCEGARAFLMVLTGQGFYLEQHKE